MDDLLRAVIVEDEPLSRDLLRSMLEESDRVEVVAVAANVAEAVDAIRATSPDVVFLDIEMPDGTGFDVVERFGARDVPALVFVTAYDRYAIRAFDVMALDYLLKPFDEERLHQSIERVHARLRAGQAPGRSDLLELIQRLRTGHDAGYAERLAVDAGNHVKLIAVAEIDWLEAKGKHVLVHTRAATYPLREGLSVVTARLDPRDFLRVHRSAAIRIDRVREIHRWTRGHYRLVLADGTKLVTGLTYRAEVERRLLGDRRPPVA